MMNEKNAIIITHSPEETFAFGKETGRHAKPGEIYTLDGDLGAGKTVFAKGFAEGLGITEIVNSPTFTIVQNYETGRLPLWHFDVYRIGDPEEMDEIGYEDCFFGGGVCLVEWSELIEELIPAEAVRIRICREGDGETERRIEVERGRQGDQGQ